MRLRSFPIIVLALVSCSDGSPTLDTGVPNDTQVDELTTEQARQICERAEALADELLGPEQQHHFACTATGVAYDLANLGSCNASYQDCIEEPFEGEVIDFDCEAVDAPDVDGCNATVGELEACANAQLKLYDDLVDEVDCGLVDDPQRIEQIQAIIENGTDPEACASLPDACPNFFGGGVDMDGP